MSVKKNIALISHDFELQGAQRVLLWVVLLLRKEYDVTVMGLRSGPLQKEYESHGIETKIITSSYPQSDLQKFDCVIMNTLATYPLFTNYSRNFLRKKCILWIHESERDVYQKKLKSEIFQLLRHIIFSASATQKMYADLIREGSSSIIPYPIDPKVPFAGVASLQRNSNRTNYQIPKDAIVISTIGAVIKRKGQDDFIRSVLPVLAKYPEVYVAIIGFSGIQKEFEAHVRFLAETSGYSERILLIPQTNDTGVWYTMSDIFALFSYIESIPVVITEAMLYRLPVVATAVYGVSEQIDDKKTGILVPPGDIHAFTNALDFLVSNRKAAVEMGLCARKKVVEASLPKACLEGFNRIL